MVSYYLTILLSYYLTNHATFNYQLHKLLSYYYFNLDFSIS